MLNQLKYAVRQDWGRRAVVVGLVIVLNVAFGICGAAGVYGVGGMITAVSLSGLALCVLFGVCIAADFRNVRELYAAPSGYSEFLTPVPRWKILLGRVLPMVGLDFICYALGICGVVCQALILSGEYITFSLVDFKSLAWGSVIFLVNYLLLVVAAFLGNTLANSVFYRLRGRGVLGFGAACVLLYLFSWANLALGLFGEVTRYRMFFVVSLQTGFNPGMIAYLALSLLKSAALFCTAAFLMERKINI